MKLVVQFISLIVFIVAPLEGKPATINQPAYSSSGELIEAVNTLRIANGMTPYTANPILMNIAQNQASYMASIGTWTHTGPDGSRPYQRALAAGYPVAGDLSLGGWFSENVTLGINKSAQDAVLEWQGDAPHLNTMLSPNLREIGAGVALVGDTYYYVIDCGLSTGGTPVAYTPPAYLPSQTFIPNTPNENGLIVHIVDKNDTIYGLALAYGISPEVIYSLNGLTSTSTIYIGQNIYIRSGNTSTPTPPTNTPTHLPTSTPWPTSTHTPSATPIPTQSPEQPSKLMPSSVSTLIGIIVIAFGIAGIMAFIKRKK